MTLWRAPAGTITAKADSTSCVTPSIMTSPLPSSKRKNWDARTLRRDRGKLAGRSHQRSTLHRLGDAAVRRPCRSGARRRPQCGEEGGARVLFLGLGEGVRLRRCRRLATGLEEPLATRVWRAIPDRRRTRLRHVVRWPGGALARGAEGTR